MALIWVEGFVGEKALAPLWRTYALAAARAGDPSLSNQERGAATIEMLDADQKYRTVVNEADTALKALAADGKARTHVLIAGVGGYQISTIKPLTTSVRGALAFAEWALTRFDSSERPLGSVELLTSPAAGHAGWTPSPDAARQLGLENAATLPTEAATFQHMKDAFGRWLTRAGSLPRNAAFFYFSGHGLWKSEMILLPHDAQLPNAAGEGADNLIAMEKTYKYMFNRQPSIQYFFLDACQEVLPAVISNLNPSPGRPLCDASNAPIIEREVYGFAGSYTGRKAYGPADKPPYFTQELLACLEHRAADPNAFDAQSVTGGSLREALLAAGRMRAEIEKQPIQFTLVFAESGIASPPELCKVREPLQVLVRIQCMPADITKAARLYVESGGKHRAREAPLPGEWHTIVNPGECFAGADFDEQHRLIATRQDFIPRPPVFPVRVATATRPD